MRTSLYALSARWARVCSIFQSMLFIEVFQVNEWKIYGLLSHPGHGLPGVAAQFGGAAVDEVLGDALGLLRKNNRWS